MQWFFFNLFYTCEILNIRQTGEVVSISGFFSISVLCFVQWSLFLIFQLFLFCTLVTSELVRKHPNEIQYDLSVGGGLFHWRALLTFYTAQHEKGSFIGWFIWLIFKLVHFMQYEPRKYFKTDTLPILFKLQGWGFR